MSFLLFEIYWSYRLISRDVSFALEINKKSEKKVLKKFVFSVTGKGSVLST